MDSIFVASRGIFGVLSPLFAEPSLTDVFINGHSAIWLDRGEGPVRVASPFPDEAALRSYAVDLVAAAGRHVDETTPCMDVRLGDGVRMHVVLPPVSTGGTLVSIRLPRPNPSIESLDAAGFFSLIPLSSVLSLVSSRTNFLITGAAGSGKTTLLSALLGSAAPSERIIAVEDVAELRPGHPHFLSLEARQPNLEGAGRIGLDQLVREALRMRPDRLVVGECRGAEVRELFAALNTGHDGGAGTMHANSLGDVPPRIEALGALAGISPSAVARQAVSAIGAVLHISRTPTRHLAAVGRLALGRGKLVIGE